MSTFKSKPFAATGSGQLLVWKDLFTQRELDTIEAYGDSLAPMPAQMESSRQSADQMRITRVAWMERNQDTAWLHARLEEAVMHMNAQFYRYDLFGLVEAFQYTIYDGAEGGHYNWHVDLGKESIEPRKISLSLQLSDPSLYRGCDLVLEAGGGAYVAEKARGTLIAFPSYVLHRVTPVESGIRKSLVIWVSGPEFR
jgi:PKHD-type hydroxylase